MSELKLEAGKFYRTRMGIKAKLMELMDGQWFGAILSDSGRWLARQWYESGEFDPVAGKWSMDLISEWNDDDEWEDVDPSKITLDMLPLEARFRNDGDPLDSMYYYRDNSWRPGSLVGFGEFSARPYKCRTGNHYQRCQVLKSS